MKRILLTLTLIVTSFLVGFAFSTIIANNTKNKKMKKVTGIGGIFFKCKDPKAGIIQENGNNFTAFDFLRLLNLCTTTNWF